MRNFFQQIKFKYNTEISSRTKQYCNDNNKLARLTERLKFLLSCKDYGIIPAHIHNIRKCAKLLTNTQTKVEGEKLEYKFNDKLLRLEIRDANLEIKQIKNNLLNNESTIKNTLNEEEAKHFFKSQQESYNRIKQRIHNTHESKLNRLKAAKLQKFGLVFNENWFINKTNVHFPEDSQWLLSLGKKFALPVNKQNWSPVHIIADIEQAIQTTPDERKKEDLRSKLSNRVAIFKNRLTNTPREKFILGIYNKTQKFLRQNKNIIVTTSDKGNKTVVMYKDDYNNKMKELVQDRMTYKTIREDPTQKLIRENNKLVNKLHKQQQITFAEKQKLYCSAAQAPRLYGLPKIHKPSVPLRPIAASTEVPCYNLSKYLGSLLKPIISSQYNIKNALELKDRLKDLVLEDDEILVSYDVVSLFTNIPVHTAIKIILDKWNTIKEKTKMSKTQFLEILNFCLKDNNYFIYNGTYYHQTFGMPMGNPLSPTIADIVMDNLFDETIKSLNSKNIKFKAIFKYVDDTIAIIKKDDNDEIIKTLNEYHNKIKFTSEIEYNSQLPFLDTKIHKINNKLKFDWYQKEISSGRIINFNSTQPRNQKINTAKNLINKIYNICDDEFLHKNIEKVKTILFKNNFPGHIIRNLINDAQFKHNNPQSHNSKNSRDGNPIKFFRLQYIPGLTESKRMRDITHNENISFAHRANQTLSGLFTHTKDKVNKDEQSNVVYEISCSCEGKYIGTTKRMLKTRISEHKNDIEKKKNGTALAQHVLEHNHKPNFHNVKILDKEKRESIRLTLESLRIQQKGNLALNTKEDRDSTKSVYSVILN